MTAGLAVLAAALGYFVDIYDLILLSNLRSRSLTPIGLTQSELLDDGVRLLNFQMFGMLVGGILWGVLGDRRGRISVLFGSILLYSLANLANAAVQTVPAYAMLRFVAGVGLAGELGAGITLVSELMGRHTRGYGTTLVASLGIPGAVAAYGVAESFDWRVAYVVGGVLGLLLLAFRVTVRESGMFQTVKTLQVARGNFFALFARRQRAWRYLAVILVACPCWFVVGIPVTFAPEFGKALGMPVLPNAGRAVMLCYIGITLGGLVSGFLSQLLRSRKRVLAIFLGLTAAGCGVYFGLGAGRSLTWFYWVCFGLGIPIGYWAVFMTAVAEQFGTNLRATAATTAPNFVRGATVLMTSAFRVAKGPLGILGGGIAVGVAVLLLAGISVATLEETYGKDLDFVEE